MSYDRKFGTSSSQLKKKIYKNIKLTYSNDFSILKCMFI